MSDVLTAVVIDDSPVIRALLAGLLRRQGMRVLDARDGDSGLALAASERPALICVDLMLPNTSGLDVCRALRATPATADAGIVVISARPYPQDRAAALEAGADAFLSKPVDTLMLDTTVRNVLWTRRAQRRVS
ncbi:MAG: hypothetical protein AMXMBFR57_16560 [Acidimicrobiia bacterium]